MDGNDLGQNKSRGATRLHRQIGLTGFRLCLATLDQTTVPDKETNTLQALTCPIWRKSITTHASLETN